MTISSFRDLTVWQRSFDLTKSIYSLTAQLPKNELFGLTSQIQRAAVSIPSNIAEGQQRHNRKEYYQFIGIAQGSAAEVETQLLLISSIYQLDTSELIIEIQEIEKMLYALSKKLAPTT